MLFQHSRDIYPKKWEMSFPEFIEYIEPVERIKKEGLCYSPVTYLPNTTRGARNVEYIHAIVFDIDSGFGYGEPQNKSISWISYTTFSHTPEKHKWRIIIPLYKPIKNEDWQFAVGLFESIWNKLYPSKGLKLPYDKACKDSSRLYYLPSCRPNVERYLNHSITGYFLDISSDVALAKEIAIEQKKKYNHWAKVMAVKRRTQWENQRKNHIHIDLDKETRIELATDSSKRTQLANNLGARIVTQTKENAGTEVATGWTCLNCGRNDATFFFIDPTRSPPWAWCGHQNSCGGGVNYQMTLFQLWRGC